MQKTTYLFILAACACTPVLPAGAAELEFKPALAVSEEFTDNVFETAGNRRHEFITRLQPGFAFKYQAPRLQWDTGYTFDYRRYERNSQEDEINHDAGVKGKLTLLENLFYVEVSDTYRRVSQDVARDVTNQGLFQNQTDQNIATVSPYFTWRLGQQSTLKTGYRYNDVRYWGVGIEKREHGVYADLSHELSDKMMLTSGYAFTRTDQEEIHFTKHDINGGFRYQYAETSFLMASVGNSWQSFSSGSDASNLFWNVGLTHDLGLAVATLETRVQYTEDPLSISTRETVYSARLDRTLQRGTLGLSSSYSEFVDSETDQATQRKFSIGAVGSYELLESLTGRLSVLGERFHIVSGDVFPYRFSATAGLGYALNNGISLGLTYTYVAYHTELEASNTVKKISRAVVDIRKTF